MGMLLSQNHCLWYEFLYNFVFNVQTLLLLNIYFNKLISETNHNKNPVTLCITDGETLTQDDCVCVITASCCTSLIQPSYMQHMFLRKFLTSHYVFKKILVIIRYLKLCFCFIFSVFRMWSCLCTCDPMTMGSFFLVFYVSYMMMKMTSVGRNM
jgi:hypothetical protein